MEPKLISCTLREADGDLQIECRFDDGQKFAAIEVDERFPLLAQRIVDFLNSDAQERCATNVKLLPLDTGVKLRGLRLFMESSGNEHVDKMAIEIFNKETKTYYECLP